MDSTTELIPPGGAADVSGARRPMIVVQNAHVTYRVYASGKQMKAGDGRFSLRTLSGGRGIHEVHAVRGISFTAHEGEAIGVVGHNGSGKSTLFNAMSGLIPASSGAIWARDRPVLLGVNAALLPQLSGENNIKLGLMAMGFTAAEAAAQVDEIADFAELNEFIQHPMRTYSAGMGARLRFAIGSAKTHSILLIDEALAVGDRRFKAKSEERIRELHRSAGLVMIVSHSVNSLKDTCERVLWVHKGELRADGPAKDVIDEYVKWTKQPNSTAVGAAPVLKPKPTLPARPKMGPPAVSAASTTSAGDQTPAGSGQSDPSVSPAAPGTVAGGSQAARYAARRERYRRKERQRNRGRLVAVAVTVAVIILAVAAGAAVALVSGLPRPSAPADAGAGTTSSSPTSSAGSLAVIRGFSASAATALCASAAGEVPVQLSWMVDGATMIAVASGATEVDAIDAPLAAALPASVTDYVVAYPCAEDARTFTLTAEGIDGHRVGATVVVARALSDLVAPGQNSPPTEAPVDPVPDVTVPTGPATEPARRYEPSVLLRLGPRFA